MQERLRTQFLRLWQQFLFRFLPLVCLGCKRVTFSDTQICAACSVQIIPPMVKPCCKQHGQIPVYALGNYDGPLVNLITAKYHKCWLSSKHAARLFVSRVMVPWQEYDLIVPIPMHWKKRLIRGYNQTDEIARIFGEQTNIPVGYLLIKKQETVPQAACEREQRLCNVRHTCTLAFGIEPALITGKRILLVDDLYTTGATIHEALRVLAASKPASIGVAVLARA